MVLDSNTAVFLTGALGAALVELLHWWGLRQASVLPQYATRSRYWITTLALVAAGGLVALVYFGSHADGIIVLHTGAGTPLIIQKFATTIPEAPGSKAAAVGDSYRRFFTW